MSNHYTLAKQCFADFGVDTELAMQRLASIPISLHCWQGDDVGGFEREGAELSGGGIQTTGNYPGKARSLLELKRDLDQAFALVPGKHRLNLHASYGDFGGKPVERNEINVSHFDSWIDWAKERGLGLDFNPTFFSHPLANDGATLTHRDPHIRQFWIDHGIACRRIGVEMGRRLGSPTVTNVWIPDGSKDLPVDRKSPRQLLERSLDEIFAEELDPTHHLDAVESKLFGIGSEAFVPGSHEFYLGYAVTRRKLLCLDAGHFHPTETLADKISAVLQFAPAIILHVSRGVRWDSDHVVLFDDATRAVMEELVRGDFLDRTHIGLDFSTPASIASRLGLSAPGQPSRRCSPLCWSQRNGCAPPSKRATSPRGWPCWRKGRRCPSGWCGTNTAADTMCRSEPPGWMPRRNTKRTCLPPVLPAHERGTSLHRLRSGGWQRPGRGGEHRGGQSGLRGGPPLRERSGEAERVVALGLAAHR